jgi:hypothetical protein
MTHVDECDVRLLLARGLDRLRGVRDAAGELEGRLGGDDTRENARMPSSSSAIRTRIRASVSALSEPSRDTAKRTICKLRRRARGGDPAALEVRAARCPAPQAARISAASKSVASIASICSSLSSGRLEMTREMRARVTAAWIAESGEAIRRRSRRSS